MKKGGRKGGGARTVKVKRGLRMAKANSLTAIGVKQATKPGVYRDGQGLLLRVFDGGRTDGGLSQYVADSPRTLNKRGQIAQ